MKRRRWKQFLAEKMRQSVKAVARPQYLTVTAVALAVVLSVLIAPRSLSNAAAAPAAGAGATPTPNPTPTVAPNDEGVTWDPSGIATQGSDSDGCDLYMYGTVSGANAGVITAIDNALNAEQPVSVDQDGIDDFTTIPPASESGATSMGVYADAKVDCSLENQTDAYLKRTGRGSLDHFAQMTLDAFRHPRSAGGHAQLLAYDALPQWARAAVGAIVGSVASLAVSVVVVAAAVALGAATTASGGLATPALAAFAGCIGGGISYALSLSIAGATTTPLARISAALTACLTYSLYTLIPTAEAGVWAGNMLRQVLGLAPATVVGQSIVQDAVAAGVDLTPVSQALQDAASALAP